jgi:hypothetical protein
MFWSKFIFPLMHMRFIPAILTGARTNAEDCLIDTTTTYNTHVTFVG